MTVSMSTVWDRTSEFLSDRLGSVASVAALMIFAPQAVMNILDPLKKTGGPGWQWVLALLSLGFAVLSFWGQLSVTAMAIDPALPARDARALGGRRLGRMILVVLAMAAAVVLLVVPVFAILASSGVNLSRLGQPGAQQTLATGAGGFIALYLLLLLPIGLWLMARFVILSAAVVVAENKTLAALSRAFRLTRGLGIKIIGVMLLYGLVIMVATLAAVSVFGGLFALLFRGEGTITIASILTALVAAAVATAFSVLGAAFAAKLYLATRTREDATPA